MLVAPETVDFSFLQDASNRQEALHIAQQLDKLVDSTAENKRKLIEDLGNVFLIDGVAAHEISTKLTETIGDFVEPRWIRTVCAEHKWTNPNKNTSSAAETAAEDSSNSLNTFSPSSPEYEMRFHYRKIFEDIEKLARMCKEEIEKDYDFETTESGELVPIPRNWKKLFENNQVRDEYFEALGNVFYNIQDVSRKCVDSRQSILPLMLFPFLAKISITTIKHFASRYFANVKNLQDITTKKCTQFLKSPDTISDLLDVTKDDACAWGTLDLKCPVCKNHKDAEGKPAPIISYLKPRMYADGTWDFVCSNWQADHEENKHFDHDILTRRINVLRVNSGRASITYLRERGLDD